MALYRSSGEWSLAVRQQASVAHIGQLGLKGGELDLLLSEALAAAAETLAVETVLLFELLSSRRELQVRAAIIDGSGVAREVLEQVRLPAGRDSMPGFTVLQGEAVVSRDLANDDRFQARASDYGLAAQAAITAPVGWGESPWGVLGVYDDQLRSWTDDDLHFVQSMANTIGLAIARQRVEHELLDSSARLDLSLGAGGLGSWTWDTTAEHVVLSDSALSIYGLTADQFDGSSDTIHDLVHLEDRAALRGDAYEAVQTTGEQHAIYRVIRPDTGEIRWVESWGRLVEEDGHRYRLVGVISDITERRLADESREALLSREQSARVEAEQAQDRLSILVEASARFSEILDPDRVLSYLSEFCVSLVADVCVVDVFDGGREIVEAAAAAPDQQALADTRDLRQRAALLGVTGFCSGHEVANGAPGVLLAEITDEHYRAAATDPEHLAIIRRLHPRSSIVVPMVARGRVLGVLTIIVTGHDRRYGPDHLALAEALAARAALALDNGRLLESRNRVARSLQAALLPPALPEIARLGLGARYGVAEGDIEIGGDFYDVMELGERAWGVVVGDVCGRGPDAAALTGLMRHSLRTAVVREQLPSRVLGQTNDAVLDQIDDARFCTAAYLRIDVSEDPAAPVCVTASSAGHPLPAVLRADGSAELLQCAGLLLGVVVRPELVDVEVELFVGDSVILYTDGVTEARQGQHLFGQGRLMDTLRALSGADAEGIAAGLEDAVRRYQDDANDDVAILVVQVRA